MKEFGHKHYRHTAYFNFDASNELIAEFEKTKEPSRLIKILQAYTPEPIVPDETLIIFDEIQQCNRALNSLKYFCEDAPQYHVMAAGSLLGVSLNHGDPFPVGKVDFVKMYPLSFREFLQADNPMICRALDECDDFTQLPATIINQCRESYIRYSICGGLPRPAVDMLEQAGLGSVQTLSPPTRPRKSKVCLQTRQARSKGTRIRRRPAVAPTSRIDIQGIVLFETRYTTQCLRRPVGIQNLPLRHSLAPSFSADTCRNIYQSQPYVCRVQGCHGRECGATVINHAVRRNAALLGIVGHCRSRLLGTIVT